MTQVAPVLKVENLKKHFPIKGGLLLRQVGTVFAVDDVSFELKPNETLGIVGESGCGKSTLGRTIIDIYHPTAGKVELNSKEFNKVSHSEKQKLRKDIQMIFQDPYSSLNPRLTIERIVGEPLRVHTELSEDEIHNRVVETLQRVGLGERALARYPHEFSGGQRQRIAIARAIILKPKLVIADEPVSALDVSIQSQILNLMKSIQDEMGNAFLFIAHNLSVVRHMSHRVAVMYLGKIVELADKNDLFENPLHPYTHALMNANPVLGRRRVRGQGILKGEMPSPINPPTGCHFHPRCPYAQDVCKTQKPELKNVGTESSKHLVSCHFVTSQKNPFKDLIKGEVV